MSDPTLQTILTTLLEMKQDVGEIKSQTTLTNGRVTSLETKVGNLDDQQKKVKYTAVGAGAVISGVATAVWQWVTK